MSVLFEKIFYLLLRILILPNYHWGDYFKKHLDLQIPNSSRIPIQLVFRTNNKMEKHKRFQ